LACGETLGSLAGVCLPYALSRIFNLVFGRAKLSGLQAQPLLTALGWFVALSVVELALGRINAAIVMRLVPRLRQYVARSLFHQLQRRSQRYLTENFAGPLAARISETANAVKNVVSALVSELWPMLITVSVASALVLSAHRGLGLFTLAWAVGFSAYSLRAARRTQPLSHAASGARSQTINSDQPRRRAWADRRLNRQTATAGEPARTASAMASKSCSASRCERTRTNERCANVRSRMTAS
jgi:ATP-binding cassette subfamily B protein